MSLEKPQGRKKSKASTQQHWSPMFSKSDWQRVYGRIPGPFAEQPCSLHRVVLEVPLWESALVITFKFLSATEAWTLLRYYFIRKDGHPDNCLWAMGKALLQLRLLRPGGGMEHSYNASSSKRLRQKAHGFMATVSCLGRLPQNSRG